MIHQVVFTLATVCCLAIVLRRYDVVNKQSFYEKKKVLERLTVFPWIYRYLRLTTPIAALIAIWTPEYSLMLHDSLLASYSGFGLALLSLGGFVWALHTLGEQYSPCYDSYLPDAIVTSGPYRWVKHPIYVANTLLMFGLAIGSASTLVGINALVLTVFYALSARREERELKRLYPAYEAYTKGN